MWKLSLCLAENMLYICYKDQIIDAKKIKEIYSHIHVTPVYAFCMHCMHSVYTLYALYALCMHSVCTLYAVYAPYALCMHCMHRMQSVCTVYAVYAVPFKQITHVRNQSYVLKKWYRRRYRFEQLVLSSSHIICRFSLLSFCPAVWWRSSDVTRPRRPVTRSRCPLLYVLTLLLPWTCLPWNFWKVPRTNEELRCWASCSVGRMSVILHTDSTKHKTSVFLPY
jgi:hypothetical protein